MLLNTKYHGTRSYNQEDIILFKKGLPGFEELRQFILFTFEGNDFFNILHSIENVEVGFVLVSPFSIEADYEIELSEEIQEELGIENTKDVLVLNMVTVNSNIEKATVNLKAPILINNNNKAGEQIILATEKYLLKHPFIKKDV